MFFCSKDVKTLVANYLMHPKVVRNNASELDFRTSLQVFCHHVQTSLGDGPAEEEDWERLCQHFEELQNRYRQQKTSNIDARRPPQTVTNQATLGNWIPRHKSHQNFNRYRTIDQPPRNGETDPNYHHRPRYSIKARDPPKHHGPPTLVKQYSLKPMTPEQEKRWRDSRNKEKDMRKTKIANTTTTKTNSKRRRVVMEAPRSIEDQSKAELVKSMAYQHPLVCLTIGTLSANTKRALGDGTSPQIAVKACVKDITSHALATKRDAQSFLGQYIEAAYDAGLTDDDRSILSAMCPPVSSKIKNCDGPDGEEEVEENKEEEQQDDDDNDDDDSNSTNAPYKQFFQILLAHLYSRKRLPSSVVGHHVTKLFSRAAELRVAPPARRQWPRLYSTNELLQSVSSQMFNETKRMYVTGSKELEEKLNGNGNHGAPADAFNIKDATAAAPMIEEPPAGVPRIEMPPAVAPMIEDSPVDPTRIDGALPAIENFIVLNQLIETPRQIAPLSPIQQRYVSFGERQIIALFWKWEPLKQKLIEIIKSDEYFTDPETAPALADANDWSMTKSPGFILTQFVTEVGRPQTAIAKEARGFRKNARLMDATDIKEHLQDITHPEFDANTYENHGYVLKGSFKTNGHLIQLTAFKLHELQSVRYRRLAVDKMPDALSSVIGGADRYLTEIRNVVGASEDVQRIWGCPPDDIAILALDLGTEGLVGSTVFLPIDIHDINQMRGRKKRKTARGKRSKKPRKRRSRSECKPRPSEGSCIVTKNFDLFVKRKAVAQPTQRFQHWLESQKRNTTIGTGRTISEVESSLTPLRGEGASIRLHIEDRDMVEKDLDAFYNQSSFCKHKWDAHRARQEEFSRVTNSLLKMVGGTIGEKRREDQNVVIIIGLAKFVAKNGPPSLDGSFQDFFVRK
ncbi:hypothetical protein BGZ58_004168, partial [Dissophora ornata]